jgi:single-strand DNA-binding protein
MANFNKVLLMGNLTRDPELRYTPKGTAVATLGVAVNRRWKDENGQPREETTFVDVDAFGRQAENIGQYFKKGRPIFIEGRLRYQTWEDKQSGAKRSKLTVTLENFQFVDSQRNAEAGGGGSSPAPQRNAPAAEAGGDAPPPEDDDVPF